DYDVAQRHFNGQITDEEFVNAVFEPQEQVSVKQAELLGAAFTLAAGGQAEVHVGTSGGGVSSELPWNDKKSKGLKR
ncbi:recombinase, partial [Alistipes onderdonkii]